jgi:nucleoside-diphosphate-sugar epimerase
MSQHAFVTGATGFVGMSLVRELDRLGWQVTALARESSSLADIADLPLDVRIGDITDADSLSRAIPGAVDCVFHVAASTNIWSRNNASQKQINVNGTRNVVEAAIAAGAKRMVHTSSFVVWGFHETVLNEDSPRLDNSDWINYISTKHQAEEIVKQAVSNDRLDAVIVNPAHILGPGDRHNWSRMIRMVNTGKLPGVPPGGGAFADVREVAKAHIAAFHKGRTGQNYLLGGEDTMFIDVVRMTGDILEKPVPGKASPAWLLKAISRLYVLAAAITGREPDMTPEGAAMITRHIDCDSSRAVAELDYRFTPVRTLLEDTCSWLRKEGLLQ